MDPDNRAPSADAILLVRAGHTREGAGLVSARLGGADVLSDELSQLVADVVEALKDEGATEKLWHDLLGASLALRLDDELSRARLEVLYPPLLERRTSDDGFVVEQWVGYPERTIALLRQSQSERDYARTLFVYPWQPRAEVEAVAERIQSWSDVAARTRGLVYVAESRLYRFGDFAGAANALRSLLGVARQSGSAPDEAKALVRLALAELALGEIADARQTADRALAAVVALGDRIIPEHPGDTARDIYPKPSMDANFACFLDGNWTSIADHWTKAATLPERGGVAIVEAGMAAYAHALAGARDESRRLLLRLSDALATLDPTTWAYNGAVGRAGRAVWMLGDRQLAGVFRNYALQLIECGVGDWPTVSNDQTVACCAAVLGNMDEASNHFERARTKLLPDHHRPQRAILAFDQGLALLRDARGPDASSREFLQSASTEFEALGMDGWSTRAERALAGQGVS